VLSLYHYIRNYLKNPFGPTHEIVEYIKQYCAQKYPYDSLSIFNNPINMDSKDYQICACHMSDINYEQFARSLKEKYPSLDLGSTMFITGLFN
jgi:hypothetical protein